MSAATAARGAHRMEMAWYIPLLIFCARIADVSIGTIRFMLITAGFRVLPTVLGFFEVVIWVLAVGGALRYLENVTALVAYAGGFAAGSFAGIVIEDRLALGYRMVQVVSPRQRASIAWKLRDAGFRATELDGHGRDGAVQIVYAVIRRRSLKRVRELVTEIDPNAFVTVERVERAMGGGVTGGLPTKRGARLLAFGLRK